MAVPDCAESRIVPNPAESCQIMPDYADARRFAQSIQLASVNNAHETMLVIRAVQRLAQGV
ncbi:hypothetical protein HNI00_19930 [Thermoleptolyngbya oregonensis NK1-22]|uniref:Uncharacterized protein n=1 Tax=Thermoleptolyngbya oregonensis NK1-22 TaxID=2547457 RepID=A0AA97BE24_9CYAN|nr:hypothetical protein [Thermoleptolyngbya oregonensis]WOB45159.1 hypothetical protein HNI00_19930 [Thermoleptolyngbya oregonensis NK1-22]